MVKIPRKAYTLELKREAVRLVESGQRISEAARSLGVVEQTGGRFRNLCITHPQLWRTVIELKSVNWPVPLRPLGSIGT
jgi:transposase-like protein